MSQSQINEIVDNLTDWEFALYRSAIFKRFNRESSLVAIKILDKISDERKEELRELKNVDRINAIKLVRAEYGTTLSTSKNIIDQL